MVKKAKDMAIFHRKWHILWSYLKQISPFDLWTPVNLAFLQPLKVFLSFLRFVANGASSEDW